MSTVKVPPSSRILRSALIASRGFFPAMKVFEKAVRFLRISREAIGAVTGEAAPERRAFAIPGSGRPPSRKYSLMWRETWRVEERDGRTSMNRKRATLKSGRSIAASIILPAQYFLLNTAGGSASMRRKISIPLRMTASPAAVDSGPMDPLWNLR